MLALEAMGNTVQFIFYVVGLAAFVWAAVSFKTGESKAGMTLNLIALGLAAITVPPFWDRLAAL